MSKNSCLRESTCTYTVVEENLHAHIVFCYFLRLIRVATIVDRNVLMSPTTPCKTSMKM